MKTRILLPFILILTLTLPTGAAAAPRGEARPQAAGLAAAAPRALNGAVLYAAPTAQGSGNCSSWADACTLQTALTNATSGDEIWVRAGVHNPGTEREDTFVLEDGVTLYGGFAGGESSRDERDWQTNLTVLSGDIDGDDVADPSGVVTDTANIVGDNNYRVLYSDGATASAVLDGFVVTAGQATGDSSPHYYGGGMLNEGQGSPTLMNVIFAGNLADWGGGGMYNEYEGSPTLTNVTFAGNLAGSVGGGMYNANLGNPTLTNVTFTGNSAGTDGGGMYNDDFGSPTLTNVAFNNNTASFEGGGMYNTYYGSPTLTDVIFSGNAADSGGGMSNNYYGSPTLTNVAFNNNTASYGGGMYNYSYSTATLIDVTFSDNSAGEGGAMLNGWYSVAELTRVTFSNNSATNGGAMYNDESRPTLTDVMFSGNVATTHGGAMYNNESKPTLTDTTFISNTASTNGGAMYNWWYSDPVLIRVTFSHNSATNGGAMYNQYSTPTLTDVVFGNNAASMSNGYGGAMYNRDDSDAALTNVTFSGNSAANGGAMYNLSSSPTLDGGTFSNNNATNGGGVYNGNSTSSPELAHVTFISNTASTNGGAMYNISGDPTLAHVAFIGNTAGTKGGAMYNADYSHPTLTDVTFRGNHATTSGGGMYNYVACRPTLTNVTFSNNSATNGGGMSSDTNACQPRLTNVTFISNTATSNGGGVYDGYQSASTMMNVVFSGNSAGNDGGGMYNYHAPSTLVNVTFGGNTATARGGGMYYSNSSPQLSNVIIWGNSAPTGPEIYRASGAPAFAYSDVGACGGSGSSWNTACGTDNGGNIDADPLYVNAAGNLRLQLTSPAIDAGDNAAVPVGVTTDLDGNPRFIDILTVPDSGSGTSPIVDMGAYEAGAIPTWEKEIWIDGVLYAPDDSPFYVVDGSAVVVVDRVYVDYSDAITFTLEEEYTESLELVAVEYSEGAIDGVFGYLSWEIGGGVANTWYVITKTFVVNDDYPWSDHITETLTVENYPEVLDVELEFELAARIAKDGVDTAIPGDVVPFTITLEFNSLTSLAELEDVLPAGLEYVSGTLTASYGTAWYDNGTIYWNNGLPQTSQALAAPALPASSGERRQVVLSLADEPAMASAPSVHAPAAPSSVALVLDDGSIEQVTGLNGWQFIWANRFTPDPSAFPFELNQVSARFGHATVPVGGAIQIAVYEDADGNLANGAALLNTYNVTVQANNAWNDYVIDPPLLLTGPGDVVIALINRYQTGAPGTADYPAGSDTSSPSQQRSWIGYYLADFCPDPPLLPTDGLWATVDSQGAPRNWMIRGYGEQLPSEVTITFDARVSAANTVITNTAELSYMGLTVSADHVLTVSDEPIAGLAAHNDSPTALGGTTTLSATITAGTSVVYEWDLGDGERGTGQVTTHVYPAVGTYTATVTATNGLGYDVATTVVTVIVPNTAPAFTSAPVTTATQDVPYSYAVTAEDANGDPLVITAPTRPAWLALTDHGDGTATLSGTPTNAHVGAHAVALLVTDSGGLTGIQSFTITVTYFNDPPTFTSAPVTTATQDALYSYAVTAADPDLVYGDALILTAPTRSAWLALTDHGDGTATLSGTPTNAHVGDHAVVLRVTDSGGLFAEQGFVITVSSDFTVYLPLVVRGNTAAQRLSARPATVWPWRNLPQGQ